MTYLSTDEFVARFGEAETIRLTDEEGDGFIGEAALAAAIAAVAEIADGYIAARYAVPLNPPPAMVKSIVADLARARLYPRDLPEGVDTAAKAALRMLEQISKGLLTLPSAAPLAPAPSASPVLVSPGHRQYPDRLKDY